jgi:hypothetical protein
MKAGVLTIMAGVLALVTSVGATSPPPRIAIAAGPDAQEIADLLIAQSSGSVAFQILERISLGEILKERDLDFDQVSQRLAAADGVLLLEWVAIEMEKVLVARLISSKRGSILWSTSLPVDNPTKMVEVLSSALSLAAPLATSEGISKRVTLSLKSFGPKFDPTQPAAAAARGGISFVRLLAGALASRPGLEVAERLSLSLPGFEQQLAGISQNGFAAADVFVEGDFSLNAEGTASTIALTPAGQSTVLKKQIQSSVRNPIDLIPEIVAAIEAGLGELANKPEGRSISGFALRKGEFSNQTEANAAYDEAQRLFKLKEYEESERRATSARELGNWDHPGLAILAVKAKLSDVFYEISGREPPSYLERPGYTTGYQPSQIPMEPKPDFFRPITNHQWRDMIDAMWMLHDVITNVVPGQHGMKTTTDGRPVESDTPGIPTLSLSTSWSDKEADSILEAFSRFFEERLWDAIQKQGPASIKVDQIRELHSVALMIQHARERNYPFARPWFDIPLTYALFDHTKEAAVERLRNILGPQNLDSALESGDGSFSPRYHQSRFMSLRDRFSYFIRSGGPAIGDDNPIVDRKTKWKFEDGQSVDLDNLIGLALQNGGDNWDLIRQTDSRIFELYRTETPDDRHQLMIDFREWLIANSDSLARLQMLSAYGQLLAGAESVVECPGSLASPDSQTQVWWQQFHAVVVDKQSKCNTQLSQALLNQVVSRFKHPWRDEFTAAIIADLERFNQRSPEEERIPSFNLTLLKGRYPTNHGQTPPSTPTNPSNLPIPSSTSVAIDAEKLDILDYAYTYPGRKIIDSGYVGTRFYFLVASRFSDEAEIVVFDMKEQRFADYIKLPEGIGARLSSRGQEDERFIEGALSVSESTLVVVAPGIIGTYSLDSKSWKLTEAAFLEDKQGFRCLENRVICYIGQNGRNTSGPISMSAPKNRFGLYSLDLQTLAVTTYFDTTRRPTVAKEDEATSVIFFGKPVPLGQGEFFIGLQAEPFGGVTYRARLDGELTKVYSHRFSNYGVNWDDVGVYASEVVNLGERSDQGIRFSMSVSGYLARTDTPRGIWPLLSTGKTAIPSRVQFPEVFRGSGKVDSLLTPLIWADQDRFFFLSPQRLQDPSPRRFLYFWPAGNKTQPIRIALRLGGLIENPKDTYSDDKKRSIESEALSTVERLLVTDSYLVFMTRKGVWYLQKAKWEEYISNRLKKVSAN